MAKNDPVAIDETGADTPAPVTKRLGDLTGGIGHLQADRIGTATVFSFEFVTRPVHKLNDAGQRMEELEDKEIAIITVENGNRFYTMSEPLIAKLKEVDVEELPALAKFDIKDTAGGRRVWTIE